MISFWLMERIEELKQDLSNAEQLFQNNFNIWKNDKTPAAAGSAKIRIHNGKILNPEDVLDEYELQQWTIRHSEEEFLKFEVERYQNLDPSLFTLTREDLIIRKAQRKAYLTFLKSRGGSGSLSGNGIGILAYFLDTHSRSHLGVKRTGRGTDEWLTEFNKLHGSKSFGNVRNGYSEAGRRENLTTQKLTPVRDYLISNLPQAKEALQAIERILFQNS